ncbi:hypothetical protein PF005_g30477 [Phytophthora fragariae]|uniref:Uncharacterized protein n=2 Tax=Phytophthora TaxID=4783 RepID=A0A6A3DKK3_9STRA|nr:hypothetical protein PF003_g5146 [Phytophthora fragariae]KAE9042150.1 hypothetical protein PR002_g4060 [Phytophthora rubi]KAE8918970.1 hypothetical protein PF009_g30716 [Phytophthora fragariae]KAE8961732.1 hypothetical protein PF011_g29640 [Phytophthora fragariae]KAE9048549.1 hypothetical protein PR001_g3764 [Phytophthora rubi]
MGRPNSREDKTVCPDDEEVEDEMKGGIAEDE